MGSGYLMKCDHCGYSVKTSGPWEFYRDEKGERHAFGHPIPISAEAAQRGVYGLSGTLYCPACDKVVDVILVEFKEPCRDSLKLWSGQCEPDDNYLTDDVVRCPECKNKFLILEPDNKHALSCPRCGKGMMTGNIAWIS